MLTTTRFYGGMHGPWRHARIAKRVSSGFSPTIAGKDDEIDTTPEVCLIFIYPNEKVYLPITGEAFVAHDPERARTLWN